MNYKFKIEHVSYEELYIAYIDCRKRKRNTINATEFEINLNKNLYILWKELNNGTYEIGRSIVFLVDKPVVREVFAANFRDRIVHHLIINRILKAIEENLIFDSYSCRVGKGTSMGVRRCYEQASLCTNNFTKNGWVLKCDLKSFFMTISKPMLYKVLIAYLKDAYVCTEQERMFNEWIIKKIIFHCPQKNCHRKPSKAKISDLPKEKSLFNCDDFHGLPIGNLSSQIFANFFMSYFDHYIKEELGIQYYGRYVDDFYIFHEDKNFLLSIIPLLKNKLMERGIKLHPKKLYLQEIDKGVKFIGGVIKPNRIYIANRTKGNFYDAIHRLNNLLVNSEINGVDINYCCSVINSYLGFLKQYKTYNIRTKMLSHPLFVPWYKYLHTNCGHYKVICNKKHDIRKYHV